MFCNRIQLYFREVHRRLPRVYTSRWNLYSKNACGSLPPQSSSCDTPPPLPFPPSISSWLEDMCDYLIPETMHILDGSEEERQYLVQQLLKDSVVTRLREENNCLMVRSHECDDGRDESRVFTSTHNELKHFPRRAKNSKYGAMLGNLMNDSDAELAINNRFHRALKGKKMYVIPFMLGPQDAEVKLFGIQLTDSLLCALLTSIMARVGNSARNEMIKHLDPDDTTEDLLIKLIHSTGRGKDTPANWPFDKEKYIIINMPDKRTVWSYGSSHWDNSVLVKDSTALQMAQHLLKDRSIKPLRMSVLSVEREADKKKYIGMIGGPGSGKSVLAALQANTKVGPLKGKLISDDVTWVKQDCRLMAINPLTGIDPYVRGVNEINTPTLHQSSSKQCLLFNTGMSGKDIAWWEGKKLPDKDELNMTDWRGKTWRPDGPRAAHLNSKFFASMYNVEEANEKWLSGYGVPLDAILVLNRRHRGHPLIIETESWNQAVFHMATIRTRHHNTSISSNEVHWEPFGCRKFLGYHLGKMIDDWMFFSAMEASYKPAFPRVFLVNLFQTDPSSKDVVWTGYEDNKFLINWVLDRLDGAVGGQNTPMGILPEESDFTLPDNVQYTFQSLVRYDPDYWQCELNHIEDLMTDQMPSEIPEMFCRQFFSLKNKLMQEQEKKKTLY